MILDNCNSLEEVVRFCIENRISIIITPTYIDSKLGIRYVFRCKHIYSDCVIMQGAYGLSAIKNIIQGLISEVKKER